MRQPNPNRRISVISDQGASDGAGGRIAGEEILGQTWAEIIPGAVSETSGEGAALARARAKILMRAGPLRPLAGQIIRAGARRFRLLAVSDHDAAGRWIACLGEEEVAR